MEPITYIKIALALILNFSSNFLDNDLEITRFINVKKDPKIEASDIQANKNKQYIIIDCGNWKR